MEGHLCLILRHRYRVREKRQESIRQCYVGSLHRVTICFHIEALVTVFIKIVIKLEYAREPNTLISDIAVC